MNQYFQKCCVLVFCAMLIPPVLSSEAPRFGERRDLGEVKFKGLHEASGIVNSRKNNRLLWTHNDSGDRNVIYGISMSGELKTVVQLEGITLMDCEDIAIGPGPQENVDYIYLGDFGDNKLERSEYCIFRFPEPGVSDSKNVIKLSASDIHTIRYTYTDGMKNAETLMIDPLNGDIFIASKELDQCDIYRITDPVHAEGKIVAKKIKTFNWGPVVAGDISRDGKELLLKTYFQVFYWIRERDDSIEKTLSKPYTILNYIPEPQGEAIGWASNGEGFFTISEMKFNIIPRLYFYPRLENE